jgi:hypothetical protein
MPTPDPIPPKVVKEIPTELRFTIPPALREAFFAEPRILITGGGPGVLLFSKELLKDSKVMTALANDAEFNKTYNVVAMLRE